MVHPNEVELQRFADDEADSDLAWRQIAAHVTACEHCRRTIEYARAIRAALTRANVESEDPEPPPELLDWILRDFAAGQLVDPSSDPGTGERECAWRLQRPR